MQQSIFFLDGIPMQKNQSVLDIPYRSDYYGIGFCMKGKAILNTDLDKNTIEPNSIMAMSPQIIKQWQHRSKDFRTLTLFFKSELMATILKQTHFLDQFVFFQSNQKHALSLEPNMAKEIEVQMQVINKVLKSNNAYKTEIAVHKLCILLYQFQSFFQQENFIIESSKTRSQHISCGFKDLVSKHFIKEHGVKFYAENLFITTKHLTEIIKAETGKTASDYIQEALLLEAKVLLANPNSTVNEVALYLQFNDQSAFGKFFKNLSQISPKDYKNSLLK
jgi:AraC family transcriptional regulator, transcriptional activator of pobA